MIWIATRLYSTRGSWIFFCYYCFFFFRFYFPKNSEISFFPENRPQCKGFHAYIIMMTGEWYRHHCNFFSCWNTEGDEARHVNLHRYTHDYSRLSQLKRFRIFFSNVCAWNLYGDAYIINGTIASLANYTMRGNIGKYGWNISESDLRSYLFYFTVCH